MTLVRVALMVVSCLLFPSCFFVEPEPKQSPSRAKTVSSKPSSSSVPSEDGAESDPGGSVLRVQNKGDVDIVGVFGMKSDEPGGWGPNLLGDDPIAPGEWYEIDIVTGTWDFRVEDDGGGAREFKGIDLEVDETEEITFSVD